VCGEKDPLKQISLLSAQFNIFLQNFQRLFPTQLVVIVANSIISPFVVGVITCELTQHIGPRYINVPDGQTDRQTDGRTDELR